MKNTLYLLLASVLFLAACTTPTPTPAPVDPAGSSMPALTDPSQPITVNAGEVFMIVVESNPSTGYHWEVVGDLSGVELVSREYTAAEPVIPGSGGISRLVQFGPGYHEIHVVGDAAAREFQALSCDHLEHLDEAGVFVTLLLGSILYRSRLVPRALPTMGLIDAPLLLVASFGTLFAFIAFFMSTVVQGIVAFDLSGNNRAVGFVVFAQGDRKSVV